MAKVRAKDRRVKAKEKPRTQKRFWVCGNDGHMRAVCVSESDSARSER